MTSDRERLVRAVGQWAGVATDVLDRCGRPDLAEFARSLGRRVESGVVRVVVVGDFKQGKSSLVNAVIGDDACSTDVVTSTRVPTVCRSTSERAARVIERHHGGLRRRSVSDLEAHAAQEGSWDDAVAVEFDTMSTAVEQGIELVDCPPASGRRSSRAATVTAARNADVALFVSDATQPLTEPELEVLRELADRVPTLLVVTKCDLAVHWREVVALNERTLTQLNVPCGLVSVSAHLWTRGRTRDGDDRSGIDALVQRTRGLAEDARGDALLADAPVRLADALLEAREEQERALAAFGDPERLRERLREAERQRDRCESLRAPTAAWQRLLDTQSAFLEVELRELTEERLAAIRTGAGVALAEIDPSKDWETFEPWLRDEAGAVATSVIAEAEPRVDLLAQQVAQAFSDSDETTLGGFAQLAPETSELEVRPDSTSENRMTRFLREGFATLGSTSGGLLAFATLGGVISAAVLAPLTVVLGAGLGGTAVISERRTERGARQQRATEAVDRYLTVVNNDIGETVVAGLGDFRARTRDQLIARADLRAGAAQDELETAHRAMEDAGSARERVALVSGNLADIDDLLERIGRRANHVGDGR